MHIHTHTCTPKLHSIKSFYPKRLRWRKKVTWVPFVWCHLPAASPVCSFFPPSEIDSPVMQNKKTELDKVIVNGTGGLVHWPHPGIFPMMGPCELHVWNADRSISHPDFPHTLLLGSQCSSLFYTPWPSLLCSAHSFALSPTFFLFDYSIFFKYGASDTPFPQTGLSWAFWGAFPPQRLWHYLVMFIVPATETGIETESGFVKLVET